MHQGLLGWFFPPCSLTMHTQPRGINFRRTLLKAIFRYFTAFSTIVTDWVKTRKCPKSHHMRDGDVKLDLHAFFFNFS